MDVKRTARLPPAGRCGLTVADRATAGLPHGHIKWDRRHAPVPTLPPTPSPSRRRPANPSATGRGWLPFGKAKNDHEDDDDEDEAMPQPSEELELAMAIEASVREAEEADAAEARAVAEAVAAMAEEEDDEEERDENRPCEPWFTAGAAGGASAATHPSASLGAAGPPRRRPGVHHPRVGCSGDPPATACHWSV
ncbi:hypothetical protein ZWY2020_002781 [Hordeum vulgare]|nr:hypothetical protein ZWY2020_002781 [Hordeum vulgare]